MRRPVIRRTFHRNHKLRNIDRLGGLLRRGGRLHATGFSQLMALAASAPIRLGGELMFLNILVLVDGSPDAQAALSQAIDLAKSEHSRLTVLTAIAPPPPTAALAGVDALAIQRAETEADEILGRARDQVPDDLPVATLLLDQPVRQAVIPQVAQGHRDLVGWAHEAAVLSARRCSAASAILFLTRARFRS